MTAADTSEDLYRDSRSPRRPTNNRFIADLPTIYNHIFRNTQKNKTTISPTQLEHHFKRAQNVKLTTICSDLLVLLSSSLSIISNSCKLAVDSPSRQKSIYSCRTWNNRFLAHSSSTFRWNKDELTTRRNIKASQLHSTHWQNTAQMADSRSTYCDAYPKIQ